MASSTSRRLPLRSGHFVASSRTTCPASRSSSTVPPSPSTAACNVQQTAMNRRRSLKGTIVLTNDGDRENESNLINRKNRIRKRQGSRSVGGLVFRTAAPAAAAAAPAGRLYGGPPPSQSSPGQSTPSQLMQTVDT